MNSNSFRLMRGQLFREVIALLLFASLTLQTMQAAAPGWWSTQGALKPQAQADDFAALNQGQLKLLASRAWLQMELSLPGGAGAAITQMINQWRIARPQTDDYSVVNIGQMKKVARPFYERLAGLSLLTLPTWIDEAGAGNADDYAAANLGQAKAIFSFTLPQAISAAPQRLSGNGMSGLGSVTLPSGYTWGSGPPPAGEQTLAVPGLPPPTTQDVVSNAYSPTDFSKLGTPPPLVWKSQGARGSFGTGGASGNPNGAAFSVFGDNSQDNLTSLGALGGALEDLSQIDDDASSGAGLGLGHLWSYCHSGANDSLSYYGEQSKYSIFGGVLGQSRNVWFKINRRVTSWNQTTATNELVSQTVEITPYSIAATEGGAEVMNVSSQHWGVPGETEDVNVSVIYPSVLQVNDGDADGDDIPDFADGISTTYPTPDNTPDLPETANLQALGYNSASAYNSQGKFRFIYNASNPAQIQVTTLPDGTKQYQPAGGGGLRLWSQKIFNSVQVNRDPRSVSAGGDFVAPNEWISVNDLGSVYCESVALSQQLYDQTVTVEVDPDGDDGPEPVIIATKFFFTSVGLALEKVEGGVIGQRDMRMRPSLPNPVINLQSVKVTNPHTSEDGTSLLVDISFSGTVNSAVCDLTQGTETGTIQKAYASVNDQPLPQSVVSLTVSKVDTPAAQDRPYPYQGTFTNHKLTDVVVTEGQNTLSLMVSDPMYHLSGTAEVDFQIEATPPAALGDSTGSVVMLELPVAGSTLAADEARLSISVDDEPLVDNLVLKKQAGGLLYRSADGQASFQFTQPPALSATTPEALHGYVTLPQSGWQGAAFSPLNETDVNTGVFIWSAEETYGDYWGWSVRVGGIGEVEATGPGELHPYTVRLQGPSALLEQVHQIHLGGHALPVVQQEGIFRVADALHPERPVTLAGLPIPAVPPMELNEDDDISQDMEELESGWTWEEQDLPEEDQNLMEESLTRREASDNSGVALQGRLRRQSGTWWENVTSIAYYQGFVVGFLDNPYSSAKDSVVTLVGVSTKAAKVAFLISPLGVLWEFTAGDQYQGNIKAATQAARRAKETATQTYQVIQKWGPVVIPFLFKLGLEIEEATGNHQMQTSLMMQDIPGTESLGPELRFLLDVFKEVIYMADDALAGMTPYERGYWHGYIAFEIMAAFISGVLTAPEGGVGAVAMLARHGPTMRRVFGYLEKLLGKLSDVAGLAKLSTKLHKFNLIADELGDFCFVAGTPVLTLHGPCPIEKVEEGEWVWSRNDETSEWGWRPVVKTFITHPETLVHVNYEAQPSGGPDAAASEGLGLLRKLVNPSAPPAEITCTPGHLIHARRGVGRRVVAFIAAGALLAGDLLTLADGRDAVIREVRVEQAALGTTFTTYNFTVEEHHTYFVGEQPVWVHNIGLDDCGKLGQRLGSLIVKYGDDVSQYFNYLKEARGALSGSISSDRIWCNGYKKMTSIMVEAFRKGDITDVDLLPTYNQIKNSLAESASLRKIVSVDMDVHHIVPESVLRMLRGDIGGLPSDYSLGDVAAVALSKADHSAITKAMQKLLVDPSFRSSTPASKARALVNWYETNGYDGQAKIAKAWLQKKSIW